MKITSQPSMLTFNQKQRDRTDMFNETIALVFSKTLKSHKQDEELCFTGHGSRKAYNM